MLLAAPAQAQVDVRLRGFADIGARTFMASDSFKSILGSARGFVFGAGIEADLPWRTFVSLRASRFSKTGERLFLFNYEEFSLGIPTTITVTPIELTGGYRHDEGRRIVPYAGLGIGWHGYRETSDFSGWQDNVKQRFVGFHLLGGAQLRLTRWIGAAGELQWATVPDALGEDPNGVSREFREDNLGGTTFRLKLVIGS
jgi:hypothetical protein